MAGVRKKGKNWQIWWINHQLRPSRQWETLSRFEFRTKREASREALRREIEGLHPEKHNPDFIEYVEAFIKDQHVEASTAQRNLYVVKAFSDFLRKRHPKVKLKGVTETIIRQYIALRSERYSPAGINIDLRFLRQVFNDAVIKGIRKESPLKHVKYLREEKKVAILPTKKEVQAILSWFMKNEPLLYAWLYFEATRGWRRDELRWMKVRDVDIEGNVIYIINTKTKTQRVATLKETDCLVLNEHIILLKKLNRYSFNGYLFPSRTGNVLGKNRMLEKIKKAARALGIKKNITNHLFRHYIVTRITNQTGNKEVVKAVTGHKDSRTIDEHYVHADPEAVDKALEITKVDVDFNER